MAGFLCLLLWCRKQAQGRGSDGPGCLLFADSRGAGGIVPVPFSPLGPHVKQVGFSPGLGSSGEEGQGVEEEVQPELHGGLWGPQTGRASPLTPL